MAGFRTGVACVALSLPLAACGGGGGSGTPPIALKGASYDRTVFRPELTTTEGGDGPRVIFVDEGARSFLGNQVGGTNAFQAEDGSVAFIASPPGYESTRFIRIEYGASRTPVSEGILGRFTTESLMAGARGTATYVGGTNTSEVRVARIGGGSSFDLSGGSTRVVANFDAGQVDATLDFRTSASAVSAPVDRVEIRGMSIAGNRFSGGALNSFKGTDPAPVAAFSVSAGNLASSGVFAGWNDATGAVAGGNRPAEVGGAFVADAGVNVLTGRYLAD